MGCWLGFCFLIAFWAQDERRTMRTPQSVVTFSSSPSQTYYLAAGTDNCPQQLQWTPACNDGFSLTVIASVQTADPEVFCSINRGPRVQQTRDGTLLQKRIQEVTRADNVIKKKQTLHLSQGHQNGMLTKEDTLIFDETGKFLWEQSRDGKGFSCLYSQTDL
ncbi:MAG: hypothetical protein AAGB31_07140 [Bdellovibrio sp.]